jgi:peptide/nickel transport system ATP-binding protein
MRNGSMVEQNTTRELLDRPSEAYSRGLIACLPPLDSKPARLLTIEDVEAGREAPPVGPARITDPKPAAPLLTISNLRVEYTSGRRNLFAGKEWFTAVDNVSLEIFKGETLGLAGESGCGKTSLGKAILKLIENSSGHIFYKGKSLAGLSPAEVKVFRKKVQVVFQDPYSSLNPVMTAGQMLTESINMHFPGLGRSERRKRAEGILLKTGLSVSDMKKYPHEFSGGQRQRVSIARALSTGPEFLVLDESVSALDVSVQAQILNLLNDLKDEFGLSYLFISHDLAVVKYMSDRIIIMNDGRIEEEGLPEDLFHNPASGYTRELIRSIPGSH